MCTGTSACASFLARADEQPGGFIPPFSYEICVQDSGGMSACGREASHKEQ